MRIAAISYNTSFAHLDKCTCKNVFPHVRLRVTTPTTGSVFDKMADRKQIVTFELRFFMEIVFFDIFNYFSHYFLYIIY